ncbi:hypothetical protein BX070DRAFT_223998 [Coemansia spiralis]|nr:hypothetical protein BX070DRAFT_223998 [Coemansia spiralis]
MESEDPRGQPTCGRSETACSANSHTDKDHSCYHCCHKCQSRTQAERLADNAAKDAGWHIPWPRIRMMSSCPELQSTDGTAQQHERPQPRSSDRDAARSAWVQLKKFVSEVTEVFGQPLASAMSDRGVDDSAVDEETEVGESDTLQSHDPENILAGIDDQYDTENGVSSHGELVTTGSYRQRIVNFARRHPLLSLMLGWMLMVFVDWFLTSSAIPRLVSLLTARPWSPFSESFVLRASIMEPGLLEGDGIDGLGIKRAIKAHLLSSELFMDDLIWRLQLFISSTLLPLTRPYAFQWLCFALLSFHILKRNTKLGRRAVLLYITYFTMSNYVLLKMFGSSCGLSPALDSYTSQLPKYTEPSYECKGDACKVRMRPTPPPTLPLVTWSESNGIQTHDSHNSCMSIGLDSEVVAVADDGKGQQGSFSIANPSVIPPESVRSPFADAVDEALARKRMMVERRNERIRRLHGWRQYIGKKNAYADSNFFFTQLTTSDKQGTTGPDGEKSFALPALATFAVYLCLGFAVRKPSFSTVRLCVLLFVLDMVVRNGYGGLNSCKGSCGRRVWDAVHGISSTFSGLNFSITSPIIAPFSLSCSVLSLARAFVVDSIALCTCMVASSSHMLFATDYTPLGCMLPIYVLSMFLLLVMRECAFAVHNMRVWYTTVVRERRRGPAILSAKDRGQITVTSTLDEPDTHQNDTEHDPKPSVSTVFSRAGRSPHAAYVHRVCFLCLSGYCERCLLSMEIWPTISTAACGQSEGTGVASLTATASTSSAGDSRLTTDSADRGHKRERSDHILDGDTSGSGGSNSSGSLLKEPLRLTPVTAAAVATLTTASSANARRKGKSHRHGKTTSTISGTTDPFLADAGNGLPSLRESLLNLSLLDPSSLSTVPDASGKSNVNASGVAISGNSNNGRRGKTVDAWITSSVAHCPCRLIHGVGPSSFVPKANKLERMRLQEEQAANGPIGTLLPLAQYVKELKSLGLVRPVDPISVVYSDEDPTASVLPLIFGRFAMPENPRAVAAANALLASSNSPNGQMPQMTTGYTPGNVPFLGSLPAEHAPSLTPAAATVSASSSSLATLSSPSSTAKTGEPARPSRILAKPTPLSMARMPGAGTFRLCVDDVQAYDGIVKLKIVMTPVLVHLLLTHPQIAPTAAVCVPASLINAMTSRSRQMSQLSPGSAIPAAASSIIADIDPFLDYVRVQLLRSDIVMRVNGTRWHDFEITGSFSQPILIRGLATNRIYSICLSVCGMRSEELLVVVPSTETSALAKAKMIKQLEIAVCVEQLDEVHKNQQAAQQRLKKIKREMPKQIQNLQNELDTIKRSLEKQSESVARFEPRRVRLAANIEALISETTELRAQLESIDDRQNDIAESPDEMQEQASAVSSSSGFNLLSSLDDTNEYQVVPAVSKPQQSVVEQALAEFRSMEMSARRTQDKYEDTIQELKAERAQWMTNLARITQRLENLEKAIEPVRRDLKEVTKRTLAGNNVEMKILRQLNETDKKSKGVVATGSSNKQAGSFSAEEKLERKRSDLTRNVATLRKAIDAEMAKIKELSKNRGVQ